MIAYPVAGAPGLELASFLLLISWATITHLHRTLHTDQEQHTMTNRRPLAHYTRQKLESIREHLLELEATEPQHELEPGQATRLEVIARIERELDLREMWEEGR